MSLLFVAGRQLVLDAAHQVVVGGATDRPLDDLQPPGGAQVDLDKYSRHFVTANVNSIFLTGLRHSNILQSRSNEFIKLSDRIGKVFRIYLVKFFERFWSCRLNIKV